MSCGDDADTAVNRTPGGSPAAAEWQSVTEDRSCPGTDCAAENGFTVDNQGNFTSGNGATGRITDEELATLIAAANAVADETLAAQSCDDAPAEAGTTVSVTLLADTQATPTPTPTATATPTPEPTATVMAEETPNEDTNVEGETVVVYRGLDDNTLCHRGGVAEASALKAAMDVLAQKYDNVAAPAEPTPTPTPTPTATPTPTPTPTSTATTMAQ